MCATRASGDRVKFPTIARDLLLLRYRLVRCSPLERVLLSRKRRRTAMCNNAPVGEIAQ
jgi:hypothetical protein